MFIEVMQQRVRNAPVCYGEYANVESVRIITMLVGSSFHAPAAASDLPSPLARAPRHLGRTDEDGNRCNGK
jgi:hypothetical protein